MGHVGVDPVKAVHMFELTRRGDDRTNLKEGDDNRSTTGFLRSCFMCKSGACHRDPSTVHTRRAEGSPYRPWSIGHRCGALVPHRGLVWLPPAQPRARTHARPTRNLMLA